MVVVVVSQITIYASTIHRKTGKLFSSLLKIFCATSGSQLWHHVHLSSFSFHSLNLYSLPSFTQRCVSCASATCLLPKYLSDFPLSAELGLPTPSCSLSRKFKYWDCLGICTKYWEELVTKMAAVVATVNTSSVCLHRGSLTSGLKLHLCSCNHMPLWNVSMHSRCFHGDSARKTTVQ